MLSRKMALTSDYNTCDVCDLLIGIDKKLISIADARLYNIRFELNKSVDYHKYKLLKFYKKVAKDLCADVDCGCYTNSVLKYTKKKTFRCKTPLELGCELTGDKHDETEVLLNKDNIIEQIRVLIL